MQGSRFELWYFHLLTFKSKFSVTRLLGKEKNGFKNLFMDQGRHFVELLNNIKNSHNKLNFIHIGFSHFQNMSHTNTS
jgi:hypothetical protein